MVVFRVYVNFPEGNYHELVIGITVFLGIYCYSGLLSGYQLGYPNVWVNDLPVNGWDLNHPQIVIVWVCHMASPRDDS